MKALFLSVLLTCFVASAHLNAAVIDFDDQGDTTIVDFNGQQTEWLDLTLTAGYSYNSVVADLTDSSLNTILGQQSAIKDGWRIAEFQDVADMINFYFDDNANPNTTEIGSFISLFGDLYPGAASATMGMTATDFNPSPFNPDPNYNPDPNDEDRIAAIQLISNPFGMIVYDWSMFVSADDAYVGTWLVRDYGITEVSAPTTLSLFILVVAGLTFRRK